MRYYRFMSRTEFVKLMNGEEMINKTDFGAKGAHTNSYGFCFLAEETETRRGPYRPFFSENLIKAAKEVGDIEILEAVAESEEQKDEDEDKFYSNPYQLLDVMGGVVDEGILVGFEGTSLSNLNTGWGKYAEQTTIVEYSTPNYNYNTMIPVSYSFYTEMDYDNDALLKYMNKIERDIPLDYPDKRMVCIYNKVDMNWIKENQKYFDTDCYRFLATYQDLTEDFIIDNLDKFDEDALCEIIKKGDLSKGFIEILSNIDSDKISIELLKNCEIDENFFLDNLDMINDTYCTSTIYYNYLEHNKVSNEFLEYVYKKDKEGLLYTHVDGLVNQVDSVESLDNLLSIYEMSLPYLNKFYSELIDKGILSEKEIINSKTFSKAILLTEPFIDSLEITSFETLEKTLDISLNDSSDSAFNELLGHSKFDLDILKDKELSSKNVNFLARNLNLSIDELSSFIKEENIEVSKNFIMNLSYRPDIEDKKVLEKIDNYPLEIKSLLMGKHNLSKDILKEGEVCFIEYYGIDKTLEDKFKNFSIKEILDEKNLKTYDEVSLRYIYKNFELSNDDFNKMKENYLLNEKSFWSFKSIYKDFLLNSQINEEDISNYYKNNGLEIFNLCKDSLSEEQFTKILENVSSNDFLDIWEDLKSMSNGPKKESFLQKTQNFVIDNNYLYLDNETFIDILNGGQAGFSSWYFDNILEQRSKEILDKINTDNLFESSKEVIYTYLKYTDDPGKFLESIDNLTWTQLEDICENKNLSVEDVKLILNKDNEEQDLLQILLDTPKSNKDLVNNFCEMDLNHHQILDLVLNQELTKEQCITLTDYELADINEFKIKSFWNRLSKSQDIDLQECFDKIIEAVPDRTKFSLLQISLKNNKLDIDSFCKHSEFFIHSEDIFSASFMKMSKIAETQEDKDKLVKIFSSYKGFKDDELKKAYLDCVDERQIDNLVWSMEAFSTANGNNPFSKAFEEFENLAGPYIFEKFNIAANRIEKMYEKRDLSEDLKMILLDRYDEFSSSFKERLTKDNSKDFYLEYLSDYIKESNECSRHNKTLSLETENKIGALIDVPNFYEVFRQHFIYSTLSDDFFHKFEDKLDNIGKKEELLNSIYRPEGFSDDIREDFYGDLHLKKVRSEEDLEKYTKRVFEIIDSKIEKDYTKHEVYPQALEISKEQQILAEERDVMIENNKVKKDEGKNFLE